MIDKQYPAGPVSLDRTRLNLVETASTAEPEVQVSITIFTILQWKGKQSLSK